MRGGDRRLGWSRWIALLAMVVALASSHVAITHGHLADPDAADSAAPECSLCTHAQHLEVAVGSAERLALPLAAITPLAPAAIRVAPLAASFLSAPPRGPPASSSRV
jgi:hypothetical protein